MSSASLHLWRPELRRAVMKVRPEYFTWPAERQERYGVAIPEENRMLRFADDLPCLHVREFL